MEPIGRRTGGVVALTAIGAGVPALASASGIGSLGPHGPLLWLLGLVPVVLLSYSRGRSGAVSALGLVLTLFAARHAVALWSGRPADDVVAQLWVLAVVVGAGLWIGAQAERLHGERAAALLESAELGLVLGEGGTVQAVSRSGARLLERDAASLVGRELLLVLHPEDVAAFAAALEGASGEESREVRIRLARADGSWRTLEGTIDDRRSDPGVRGHVLRARDVTERSANEELARRAVRMEAVGKLAAWLAHELNDVLTSVDGNAQLLLQELERADPRRRSVDAIRQSSARAATLVQHLLAFTRQQMLRPQVVDLNELLLETRPALGQVLAGHAQVVVGLDYRTRRVRIDPIQMRRALLNLAALARDTVPAGGRVTLRTLRVDIDDGFVRRFTYPVRTGAYTLVEVGISGVPGAPEGAPQCPGAVDMLPETRADLELSAVYGFVKQSGGYIWVEEEGGAVWYRLYLPVAEAAAGEEAGTEGAAASADGPRDAVGCNVLVVEDDPAVRSVISKTLLKRGYGVIEAENGRDALELLTGDGPAVRLVVSDVVMPEMDGRELARRCTTARPGLRWLFVSGHTEEDVQGPDGLPEHASFLSKPFRPEQFGAVVDELIAERAGALHVA